MRLPGVYRPQDDTWLLAQALRREPLSPISRVLDLCTGTGALAVLAARLGARHVTAVDVNPRAVWSARANSWSRRLPVRVLRGRLVEPVRGERFDLVLANPPYVPYAASPTIEQRSGAWDAGLDGRSHLDELCATVPEVLEPGGTLLLVQSSMCGNDRTCERLAAAGIKAEVSARSRIPFGPVMTERASWLEEQGYILPGEREEELVVIRGTR
ncbi:HemK2/MTQ2 family protein methyltransferase [Actinopolymorpha sp. NPDC004070]|uniref:HemK2/MTQ2 family protein methyltransferase n=1 Tax=Actinopolymorpha sp. NPDC004070 TaxID=3154548 RepID=UPI0033A877C2